MRVLDLFSGIGGFSLGLERAGMKTVAFCEIDPFCRQVLAKHWPYVPCYTDVRELTAARLAADGIAVDAITGGFPCQDISSAGQQAGITGERSGLWGEIARLAGEIQPRIIIVENVTNLLSGECGQWFAKVLGDLAALRYDAEWHCIPAAAVGAPHIRDRVWIVAYPARQRRRERRTRRPDPSIARQLESAHGAAVADTPEGLRYRIHVSGQCDGQGALGFQRVRALFNARRDRGGPPADFQRLRADDGLSARLDAIAAIGNAVVPQIPEAIGRAILQAEMSA